jgi:hypothetical protein
MGPPQESQLVSAVTEAGTTSCQVSDNYRGSDKSLARPTFCFMVRIFRLMLFLLYIQYIYRCIYTDIYIYI